MKYTAPDYDPKLSPERNAEIAEWAKKNYDSMEKAKFDSQDEDEKTDLDIYHEMIDYDFDEDAVCDE